jgi:hypothetical protein
MLWGRANPNHLLGNQLGVVSQTIANPHPLIDIGSEILLRKYKVLTEIWISTH